MTEPDRFHAAGIRSTWRMVSRCCSRTPCSACSLMRAILRIIGSSGRQLAAGDSHGKRSDFVKVAIDETLRSRTLWCPKSASRTCALRVCSPVVSQSNTLKPRLHCTHPLFLFPCWLEGVMFLLLAFFCFRIVEASIPNTYCMVFPVI